MNKMNVLGVLFVVLMSVGAVVVMADVNGLGSGDLVGFVNGAFSGVLSAGSLSVSGSTSLSSVSGDDGVFSGDVNATNINADNVNGIYYASPGDDLQSIINSMSRGDVLYLDNGEYDLSDTLYITTNGITIEGYARGGSRANDYSGTILNAVSGIENKDMINITANGVQLMNLILDGNDITKDGIYIGGTSAGSFYGNRLKIHSQGRDGLFAGDGMDAGNELIHIISRENGRHGMNIERNDFRISYYYSDRNWNGAALQLNPGGGIQVWGMHSFYNNYGIYMNGTDASSIGLSAIEQNNFSAIYLDSTHSSVNRITVMDTTFYGNNCPFVGCSGGEGINDHVIYLNADTNDIYGISFDGNTFDSNTAVFNYSESNGGEILYTVYGPSNIEGGGGIGNYDSGMDIMTTGETSGRLSLLSLALDGSIRSSDAVFENTLSNAVNYQRFASSSEQLEVYVSDEGAVFNSTQDETTAGSGNYGGYKFIMDDDITDEHTAEFQIVMSSDYLTPVFSVDKNGTVKIGDGSNQRGIVLTSPDGTEYTCVVANGGAFSCS